MENRETKLRRAFKNTLNIIDETNLEHLEYSKDWDSIAHLQLVSALEKEFDIRLDPQDIEAMTSYKMAREILKKYQLSFVEK